jgi:hypothetical protein
MSQETNNPNTEDKQYTQVELDAMRKGMITNYKSEISFLKVQAEYEKLSADIEEHKTRRYMAMARTAQVHAAMEGGPEDELEQELEPNKEEAHV